MPTKLPRMLLEIVYEKAAREYQSKLTLEDYMESTPQATQRAITLASLGLLEKRRTDFHLFNELLVQYPVKGTDRPVQVCPDNLVVIHEGPMNVVSRYDIPFQPVVPFLAMEYVSLSDSRKDYERSLTKYEQGAKIPYYLIFNPYAMEMILFRLKTRAYSTVLPSRNGRAEIPEISLGMAIVDDWVRFWYKGELLPLPSEMDVQLGKLEQERDSLEAERDALVAELAALRARLGKPPT